MPARISVLTATRRMWSCTREYRSGFERKKRGEMMNLYLAMAVSFVAASLTDWLFMGVLFHARYNAFPEVWRDAKDERQRIIIAQAFSAMTAIGFVVLANALMLTTLRTTLLLAVAIWIIRPLP